MKVLNNILEAIGNTPLIRLNRVTAGCPAEILVKAEFLNPGGSVKDRIGIEMIEQAERDGSLKNGGTIIEATAGNTGVGLALAAAVKGYRCIFVVPDKMSEDKIRLLRGYGAEVLVTPSAVPPNSPDAYNSVAERLSREIPGAFRPNQFGNHSNPKAHYKSTGPEIWEACGGRVDVFVAGMGTCGTISGTARFLKERNPMLTVVGADPEGSILSGDAPRGYRVEGIGEDFIPATFDRQTVDEFVRVSDVESFTMARRLAREEGLMVGGSAGTAIAAALKYSARLERGKVVVVLLPDTGRNYLSKFYSDAWMTAQGLTERSSNRVIVADVLASKRGSTHLLTVESTATAKEASAVMNRHGISQVPVMRDGRIAGSVTELTMVMLARDGVDPSTARVSDVMGLPLPSVDEMTDISEPYRVFMGGHGGVVTTRDGVPSGFLSRSDIIAFWIGRDAGGGA